MQLTFHQFCVGFPRSLCHKIFLMTLKISNCYNYKLEITYDRIRTGAVTFEINIIKF